MRMKRSKQCRAAFSLLETLLAASLLAGAVMTIGALSGRSLSAVRIDQETERAWELADMQLKLIDAFGISAFLDANITGGVFREAPNYSWSVEIDETDIDLLYDIRMEVRWPSGGSGAVRRIVCRTRLCGETAVTEDTGATGPAAGGMRPQ